MELPKYSNSSQKGEIGFTILKSIVENDLRWILRKNNLENDFGIDAYIDVITDKSEVTGKSIAVQVKTGKSYFEEKNEIGWVYRGEMKHLNYYLNHDLPVILIIIEEISRSAYWCLCDAEKTQKTKDNWKITIPFNSFFLKSAKTELIKYISPLTDYVSQLNNFWYLNKFLTKFDRINFVVERKDIENGTYQYLLDGFKRLEVNSELLLSCKNKIDIRIHGYNEDPSELYEIETIKVWVNNILTELKGCVFFLSLDDDAHFLRLMQYCQVQYVNYGSKYKLEGRSMMEVEFNMEDQKRFLNKLYENLNEFSDTHNIPEDLNRKISIRVIEFITGGIYPDKKI